MKLTYFPFRGRASLVRTILEFVGTPYDYVAIGQDVPAWPEYKAQVADRLTFGQVPSLELDDGTTLVQSAAISRYLGRRFGLFGSTDAETTAIDVLFEGVSDLGTAYGKQMYGPNFDATIREYLTVTVPKWLAHFERALERNGGSGFLVGSSTTIADLALFDILDFNLVLRPELLEGFPLVKKLYDSIRNHPRIEDYISSGRRPALISPLPATNTRVVLE